MGGRPLKPPTAGELGSLGTDQGFPPVQLERAVRLLDLIDDVASDPCLAKRVALTGGTAWTMFVFEVPRLSFDIDLNYVGSPDRAVMKEERPLVEAAISDLFTRHGLAVKAQPQRTDHAGGKWDLRYQTAWGRSESIAVDVSYVRRVPLWPITRRDSHRLGRWQATSVPVMDVHEIAAGKLAAFMTRAYPRDLFDVGLIPDPPRSGSHEAPYRICPVRGGRTPRLARRLRAPSDLRCFRGCQPVAGRPAQIRSATHPSR